ncbi:nuclear transport factor 2 family protein [Chitinimonas naiadis]
MTRLLPLILLLIALACRAATAAPVDKEPNASAIRQARQALNQALQDRDVAVIEHYWLEDVHTTGGSGSLWVGRDMNVAGFRKMFAGATFLSGRRNPERIDVARGGPKEAAESGSWIWNERDGDDTLRYQGRYLVMWQKVEGDWRIRAELYVTTDCSGGAGCRLP